MILTSSLFFRLCALIAVAFLTLLERKLLGLIQSRKGPNKITYWGIIQPLGDALKLFLKEQVKKSKRNRTIYNIIPILGLFLTLSFWYLVPSYFATYFTHFSLLLFLCLTGLNVYIITLAGWASNRLYAFLGSVRAAAQSISYEISLVFLLFFPFIVSLHSCFYYNLSYFPASILFLPILGVWLVSLLAETNRAPLDFAEGERELVSGFNVEFEGGLFAFLFLAEYTRIIFMSSITIAWFCVRSFTVSFIFLTFILVIGVIIIRGVFPRFRYDLLIMLCWKRLLPFILCLLLFLRGLLWIV